MLVILQEVLASPGDTSNICMSDSELTFPITNYEDNSRHNLYIRFWRWNTKHCNQRHILKLRANNEITHKYLREVVVYRIMQFIASFTY